MSKGDIVATLPTDFFYFPWAALSVVRAFREDSRADVIYGDIGGWNPISRYGVLDFAPPVDRIGSTLKFTALSTSSVFFDRRIIDSLGPLDETLTLVSDWDYLIRAWRSFRFNKLNEVLTCGRFNKIRGSKGLQRQIKEMYSLNSSYVKELPFTAGYSVRAAEENLSLLANSVSRDDNATRWGRLINCKGISRKRLSFTVLSTWLLCTRHRYRTRLRIGYLDAPRVSQVCFGNRTPRRNTDPG